MFISRDVLDSQDFEDTILVLLSKFEIWKKILFLFSKEWDLANRFSFSSRFFPQFLFQFSWEIIFCSLPKTLGWFWPSVFCRKGKYFKKTVLCCWAIFWLQSTKALHGDYYNQEPSLGGNGCPVERANAKHARMRSEIDLYGEWGPEEEEKRLKFLFYLILATIKWIIIALTD